MVKNDYPEEILQSLGLQILLHQYHMRYLFNSVSLFVTYGIMFWVFGKANKKEIDIFIQTGGVFMALSNLFDTTIIVIYLNFSFSHRHPQAGFAFEGYQFFYAVTALTQIRTTTYVLGIIFLVIHCKENHDRMFGYGVLFLIIFHASNYPLLQLIYLIF